MRRDFVFIYFILILIIPACSPPNPTPQTELNYDVAQESYQFQFSGIPYDIPVDNCNSDRDSTKTEERSQKYIIELHIEIANEFVAELGGDIEMARVILAREIGAALGLRIGAETTATSSVQIVTPAGKKSVTSVQWKETWSEGKIAVIRPDGSYVGVIPFAVLNSLVLEQLSSQTYDCGTGAAIPVNPTVSNEVATEIPNWAITFEYGFPAGFWSVGMHEYILEGNCPNLIKTDGNPLYGIWTQTFDVAENAALLPGDVYLRLVGLRDAPVDAQLVEKVNPQQKTTAAWTLIDSTKFEAELAVTDCTVTITWDGGTPTLLKPGVPFQR